MRPTFTEEARRAQIIGCAIEVIAELGYGQASMRKIAERAGVAMSVVSYYFGSKDDLVADIVSECHSCLIEMMLPAVEAESRAVGKLAAHIRSHLRYIDTCPAYQAAITEIANNFRSRDGERLTDLSIAPDYLDALAKIDLEVILRQGVDTGEFHDLSVESTALAIRSAIGGATLKAASDPSFDAPAYGEDLIVMFNRALTAG